MKLLITKDIHGQTILRVIKEVVFTLIIMKASYQGEFLVNEKFNVDVCNIKNDEIARLITSQLFEVTIHRVKRDFERVHSENNFEPQRDNEIGY